MRKIIQLNVTLPYYELMFVVGEDTCRMDSMNIEEGIEVCEIKESTNVDGNYDYTVVMATGENIVFEYPCCIQTYSSLFTPILLFHK